MRCAFAAIVALAACTKHDEPAMPRDAAAAPATRDAAAAPPDAPPAAAQPVPAKLVVGAHDSCAILSDKTVRCWGDSGALRPELRGVLDVALGDAHACALLDDGSVACWGKIGFGASTHQTAPAAVPGVNDAVRVFALGGAGCASEKSGALACWGDVDAAGHVTATGAHRTPTAVRGLDLRSATLRVAAGPSEAGPLDHVVAMTAHGALLESGDVVLDGKRAGTTGVVELATTGAFTCGRTDDGTVECFGAGQPCAAAEPAPKPTKPAKPAKPAKPTKPPKGKHVKPAPKPVATPAVRVEKLAALSPASHLAFDAGLCAVTTGKRIVCHDPAAASCTASPLSLANVVEVAGSCARLADGTVHCWTGDASARSIAVVRGVTGATQLAGHGDRGCALLADHSIACWTGTAPAAPVAY
ncbi:MAG TPA: RCC1 domain-containing protein [Kofleriaceae bacterium]|nr:RCC1 domain-containing protein [Kofleriaceae bacterium]